MACAYLSVNIGESVRVAPRPTVLTFSMRAYYLPELLVGLLILLLGWLLFVLTEGYVVSPAWVWIFGPAPADQPWLIRAIPLLASALLVWVELRGLGRLADFLILRAEKRRDHRRRRGRRLP